MGIDAFISGGVVLLAFVLLTNALNVNVLGNRWLGIFLLLLGILIFDKGLFEARFYLQHPTLIGYTDIAFFFIAPTLYLSVGHFISLATGNPKKDYFHFLLPVLLLPVFIYFILQDPEVKLNRMSAVGVPNAGFTAFLILQMSIYLGLSFNKLKIHQRNIEVFASSTASINLRWLWYFLMGFAGMLFVFMLEFFIDTDWVFIHSSYGYLVGVYALAYYVLQQQEIFPFDQAVRTDIQQIIENDFLNPKERSRRFSETQLLALKQQLLGLVGAEKVYLEEDLNLPKLADKIGLTTHDLSYLLNEGFGQSFFQFINTYRVEEAKRLLLSDQYQHLNMLGIAYAAGFSSKTTFYTTFKKMTRQSPAEFKASHPAFVE